MDQIMSIINALWDFVIHFKVMTQQEQIASAVLVLVGIWKSSMFKPYWDKLGDWKFAVPGVLGIIFGFAVITPFSWEGVYESLKGGLLAIAVHQLTLGLKIIPKIGPKYQKFIHFMEKILRKPAQNAVESGVKDPLN